MTEENTPQYIELLARPPVFKAFQWDGTIEGANQLSAFIKEVSDQRWTDLIKFEARLGDAKLLPYIEFPKGYINKDYSERMRPDDWLVVGPGVREILHTEALERQYIRKETDA